MGFDFQGKPEDCDRKTYKRILALESEVERLKPAVNLAFSFMGMLQARTLFEANRRHPVWGKAFGTLGIACVGLTVWNITRIFNAR